MKKIMIALATENLQNHYSVWWFISKVVENVCEVFDTFFEKKKYFFMVWATSRAASAIAIFDLVLGMKPSTRYCINSDKSFALQSKI